MLADFLNFLSAYNILWVAIGLLIATKVGELVKSLIEDLVTPLLLNPLLKKMKVEKLKDLSRRGVLYGKLLASLIDFVVVAILIFALVKSTGLSLPAK